MKFKPNIPEEAVCVSDDPYYDLFLGGYIRPSEWLDEPDASRVEEALALLKAFLYEMESEGYLEIV